MITERMLRLMVILCGVMLLVVTVVILPTPAQAFDDSIRAQETVTEAAVAATGPRQIQKSITITGINAVQLGWWFMHFADRTGVYWYQLAPANNDSIYWVVTEQDAGQHIGQLWESDQIIPGGLFPDNKLHMQVKYTDWNTNGRGGGAGLPTPLNPTLGIPADYTPPYPTPLTTPAAGGNNGFNEDMLFFDGHGFCPGRILWSWQNTGNDDTSATAGKPFQVNVYCTFYLNYMEGTNVPPAMTGPGYYYTDAQIDAIWAVWQEMLSNLPQYLPEWFGEYSQDTLARQKGFTVTLIADTPVAPGVTDKMMVWRSNHCMGDDPGNCYVFWCPPAHHTIRWLPGYSPWEVQGRTECDMNEKDVVAGAVSPDLQGASATGLVQTGGGIMWYPPEMSPITGVYKYNKPVASVTAAQVANFATVRFPAPSSWLLHQSEEIPGGLIHRATTIAKLPLSAPVTQNTYFTEHQHMEGQYLATGFMIRLYKEWLKQKQEKCFSE